MASHPSEVAFLTVERLADTVGVSPATVVRLAGALGYAGYAEMQAEVREVVRTAIAPPLRVTRAATRGRAATVLERTLEFHAELLRRVASLNTADAVDQALAIVREGRRVCVIGYGTSRAAAFHLAFGLQALRPGVVGLDREDVAAGHIEDTDARDALISICFPRYRRRTVELTRAARGRGCRILAITDSPASPVYRLAEVALLCPYEQPATPVASPVAPLALVDSFLAALTGVLMREEPDTLMERLNAVEHLNEELGTWTPASLGGTL